MSWTIIKILIVLLLLYAFVWIRSFIPYWRGFLPQAINFFLDLIKYNIYPVWNIVYVVNIWLIMFFVFKYLVLPFFKTSSD